MPHLQTPHLMVRFLEKSNSTKVSNECLSCLWVPGVHKKHSFDAPEPRNAQFVAVLGSHFVQTGEWGNKEMWLLAGQCGLYSAVLIAINNLRDRDEDEKTGKRTLAVRFGMKFARLEIAVMGTLASILIIPVGICSGGSALLSIAFAIFLAVFHLALSLRVFRTEPSAAYNVLLARAALQLLSFAVLTSIMFALK